MILPALLFAGVVGCLYMLLILAMLSMRNTLVSRALTNLLDKENTIGFHQLYTPKKTDSVEEFVKLVYEDLTWQLFIWNEQTLIEDSKQRKIKSEEKK